MRIANRLLTLIATAAAVTCFEIPASRAQYYGDAPWCAVLQIGTGSVTWQCYYRSAEDCAPHVLAGNRGTCGLNPYWTAAPPGATKHRGRYKPS